MKPVLFSVVSALIVLICFQSCSGNLRIEKRQYRDGYYFGGRNHEHILTTDSVTPETNSIADPRLIADKKLLDTTADLNDTIHIATDLSEITATDTFSNVHVTNESVMADRTPIDGKLSQEIPEPNTVPAEARGLNTWWWISLGMLVLGIIASIVAFMPFVGAGFGVLIASAPFLVLGALGIGIWLMVAARRRKLSAGSPELSNYYDKLRKRARLIVILASTVIVVFVLFLALIIAALSNFT